MTFNEANTLRRFIAEYRDAAVEESMKGAKDPADAADLVEELRTAKENLERYIHSLTEPTTI